jgi:hypothetical protein
MRVNDVFCGCVVCGFAPNGTTAQRVCFASQSVLFSNFGHPGLKPGTSIAAFAENLQSM